jgi:tetratricopeptide (TPR) repeat protein
MRSTLIALSAATLFLALSGFDCASTEMTTAKMAIRNKDYDKAEVNLKKEVAARPQNGDAWAMLADIYEQKNKYPEMLDAQEKALAATQPALSAQEQENIYLKRYNAWLATYNGALGAYRKASDGDNAQYQEALRLLDAASTLRPGYAENIYMRAAIYNEMKDKAQESATNKAYVDAVRSDVEKGMAAGLMLGMTRQQAEAKLGKAAKVEFDSTGGFMQYATNDLVLYFDPSAHGDPTLVGWKYFQGEKLPDALKQSTQYIRSAPYYSLGIDAYDIAIEAKSDAAKATASYDEALRYLQAAQQLDPAQTKAGQVIADIYGRTNRTGEAKAAFEANIKQNPNDPSAYINYGTLLVNLKDYPGAIDNFTKALGAAKEGEEKYQTALFNLGAVYKNWGADLQKAAGDKPSNKQVDEYMGKLKESAQYFERYRKNSAGDYAALAELANLYLVLGKTGEAKQLVTQLEGLQSSNESNAEYWDVMSRVYAVTNDIKKSEEAAKKADSVR